MAEPHIAGNRSMKLELAPGTYFWCACGRSKNQPFCDGSHEGSEFTPVQFTVTKKELVGYCMCKRTGDKPFCDGTHQTL